MSEAAQTHRYLPLDADRKEIRLLTVYPRSQNIPYTDPVKCTIHHVSLRETPRPQYETISYVWGNARETSTIFLNGLEAIVPTSAEQALKCIRLHTGARDRQLWIDAICIDQGNVDERAKQVHIMGDVYQCSVGNLIYIGDDDGTVGGAYLDFRHLLEEIRQETDGFRTFLDTVFDKDNHDWRGNDSPLSTKIDPAALISFYSRPWFRRLWVIQEIVLPTRSTFVCGPFELDASTVLRVSVWLNYKAASLPNDLVECQGRHNAVDIAYLAAVTGLLERGSTRRASFRYLLALSTRFDTSDPRDHIYAILDLLRSSAPGSSKSFDLIAPDYSKPTAQVFRDATIFSLLELRSLHILRNVYHRGDIALDVGAYSSWVPQWYRTFDFRQDAYRLPEIFDAALGTEVSSPSLTTAPPFITETLPLRGFRLARVNRTTESMTPEVLKNMESLNSIFQSIEEIVVDQKTVAPQSTENALARTLVVGHEPDGFVQLRNSLQQSNFIPLVDPDNRKEDSQSTAECSRRYYNSICYWSSNRRFFGASNGYMGVAASPVRAGDLVAILYGAPWPVILRPLDDAFQFVSQCYVDGVMHGEAVQEHRNGRFLDETFALI